MTISNYEDVIDSRDIIERIEELESELFTLREEFVNTCDDTELSMWVEENEEELDALKALQEEQEDYPESHIG